MPNLILLIPHYNNPKGLLKSIASIGATEEIDVLIVDDGSKESLHEEEIRASLHAKGRVFFLYLSKNKGIEHALNKGLEFILSKKHLFTARLDCGDICHPERFQKQLDFLTKHKEVSLVGTSVHFINTQGVFLYKVKVPTRDALIRKKMFINAMHIHPTIVFRNEALLKTGLYPTQYKAAEDYAFFFQVLKHCKVANLDEVLVHCELNPKGLSAIKRGEQARNRVRIILENFYVGWYPIYGLFRSLLLCVIPLQVLVRLKTILKNS